MKTDADSDIHRYIAFYRNKSSGQYLFARVDVVITDEFYWSHAAETTAETIKKLKFFRDKSIQITAMSDAMNGGYDSATGGPNYLLFTADRWSCGKMRRFSAFGRHGGTSKPYVLAAYYCAPDGEKLDQNQAARIAKNGLIYRPREDHLGNDLYPPPKF